VRAQEEASKRSADSPDIPLEVKRHLDRMEEEEEDRW